MSKLKRSRAVGARAYHNFLDGTLEMAVADVKSGLSYRKASEKYGISKSTIDRHLKGKHPGKVGRQYVLTQADENILTECIKISSEWSFPLTMFDIHMVVKSYLDKQGISEKRFNSNIPGKAWAHGFLQRHKAILPERLCQNIKCSRASMSKETISEYITELRTSLAGVPPELILNYDETNITDEVLQNVTMCLIFPVVDDISDIEFSQFSQIICVLKPLTVNRGRYTLPFELD